MGAFKNALKKVLPPPVNSFMREVNRIVALEEKNQKAIDKLVAKIDMQEQQIKNQNEIIVHQIQMLQLQETYMQQQTQMLDQQMQYMQLLNNTLADIDKHLKEQSALTNKLMEEQKNTVKKYYDEQQRINKDMRARIDNTNKEITYHYFKGLHPDQYKDALVDWYYQKTGVHMDIDNPKTFNEKIQWLKLYDSTPKKTRLADKYLVREWVAERIGEEHLIPLLGVYDKFDDIDFDALPNQFVLKANHGSGRNIVVKDKEKFDINAAKVKFDDWMKKNFAFCNGLEMHYKNIVPKIIIEEYMAALDGDIYDYRFFCYNGNPEYIWVDVGSGTQQHYRNIYDVEWTLQDYKVNYPAIIPEPSKPVTLEKMKELASNLSKGFAFVRIDFYSINEKIYFGEMTFTPQSGLAKWEDRKSDVIYGEKIQV